MKYFLFDIGNVLVDFDTADFLQELANGNGRAVEGLTESDLEKIHEVEKGEISDAEFVDYLNATKGLSWTVDDLTAVWSRMFRINEAGRGMFLDAAESGMPVYTLSNIAGFHIDAIENNWGGFFDGAERLFLSYQIGVRKPHPDIYHYTLKKLGASGGDCFSIDDLPENIAAAREVGINAHLFVPENHAAIREAAKVFFGL